MKLRQLDIKDFRSLESATLTTIRDNNVIVGQNNSGKSSVFAALEAFAGIVKKATPPATSLTHREQNRAIRFTATLEPSKDARDAFVQSLVGGQYGNTAARIKSSRFLSLVRFVFQMVPVDEQARSRVYLESLETPSDEAPWIVLQKPESKSTATSSARYKLVDLKARFAGQMTGRLTDFLDIDRGKVQITDESRGTGCGEDPVLFWANQQLLRFASGMYSFSCFRHGTGLGENIEAYQLDPNGTNLAQVLHTLLSNRREQFDRINDDLTSVISGFDKLHAPVRANRTRLEFEKRGRTDRYDLLQDEVGSGVEQLLLLLTLRETNPDATLLLLEEPESHLHPAAQRYLISLLEQLPAQTFVTTHSPTIVNAGTDWGIHQVRLDGNRTEINSVVSTTQLAEALEDIGARNSDLLLANSVVFVEGPSDEGVWRTWASQSPGGRARSVNFLHTGGADRIRATGPARAAVLEEIDAKAPIPRLFIIDRDQRSDSEIEGLRKSLKDNIAVLKRRELENYFLDAAVIQDVLREKYKHDATILKNVEGTSEATIRERILSICDTLRVPVIVKRARERLRGTVASLIDRNSFNAFSRVNEDSLADEIANTLDSKIQSVASKTEVRRIVDEQVAEVAKLWHDEAQRLAIVPGADVLEEIFASVGGRFDKIADGKRFAQSMPLDGLDQELKDILLRIANLAH